MNQTNARRGHTQIEKDVVIKNKVMLNLIQHLQRLLLALRNNLRGSSRINYGITSFFRNTPLPAPTGHPLPQGRGKQFVSFLLRGKAKGVSTGMRRLLSPSP